MKSAPKIHRPSKRRRLPMAPLAPIARNRSPPLPLERQLAAIIHLCGCIQKSGAGEYPLRKVNSKAIRVEHVAALVARDGIKLAAAKRQARRYWKNGANCRKPIKPLSRRLAAFANVEQCAGRRQLSFRRQRLRQPQGCPGNPHARLITCAGWLRMAVITASFNFRAHSRVAPPSRRRFGAAG